MIISAGRRGDQRATLHDQIWRPSMRFERPLARLRLLFRYHVPPRSSNLRCIRSAISILSVSCFPFTGVLVETRVYTYIYYVYFCNSNIRYSLTVACEEKARSTSDILRRTIIHRESVSWLSALSCVI